MVAGDHGHLDASVAGGLECKADLGPGRVMQADQAQECQILLNRLQLEAGAGQAGQGALRHGQDPQAVGGHPVHHLPGPVGAFQAAQRNHGLRGALDIQGGAHDGGLAEPAGIEGKAVRNFGLAGIVPGTCQPAGQRVDCGLHGVALGNPFALVEHRAAHGGGQRRGAEVPGFPGSAPGDLGLGPVPCADDAEHALRRPDLDGVHPVLGQRAGFVRANESGGAEGFHRFQVPDQGVALCHTLCSDGQGQCDRGQQAFGHERHGHPDREQERVPPGNADQQ
ncbi:hypothetical protein D9M72_385740 [compost metagenome]